MKKIFALWLIILVGCESSAPPDDPDDPVQTCAATIVWEAPSLRQGGLPFLLEDIERFTIYVSEAVGQLEFDLLLVLDVTNPMATTHRIENLPEQSYIYMTVTDTDGVVSPFSSEWSWDCITGEPVDV